MFSFTQQAHAHMVRVRGISRTQRHTCLPPVCAAMDCHAHLASHETVRVERVTCQRYNFSADQMWKLAGHACVCVCALPGNVTVPVCLEAGFENEKLHAEVKRKHNRCISYKETVQPCSIELYWSRFFKNHMFTFYSKSVKT